MDAYDNVIAVGTKESYFPRTIHMILPIYGSRIFYKNTKLTFCFTYKKKEALSLIDIIEDNEEEFIKRLSRCKNERINTYVYRQITDCTINYIKFILMQYMCLMYFRLLEIIDKCISSNEITKEERFKLWKQKTTISRYFGIS